MGKLIFRKSPKRISGITIKFTASIHGDQNVKEDANERGCEDEKEREKKNGQGPILLGC